jgi:hypothetical protein
MEFGIEPSPSATLEQIEESALTTALEMIQRAVRETPESLLAARQRRLDDDLRPMQWSDISKEQG